MGFNEICHSHKVDFSQQNDINSEIQPFQKSAAEVFTSPVKDVCPTNLLSPSGPFSNDSLSEEESIVITKSRSIPDQQGILTPPPSRLSRTSTPRIRRKPLCYSPSPIRVSKIKKFPKNQKKKSVKKFEISSLSFKKLVHEIMKEQSVSNLRIEGMAVAALQEASETFLTEHFVTLGRMMDLSNRKTLTLNTLMLYNCAKVVF